VLICISRECTHLLVFLTVVHVTKPCVCYWLCCDHQLLQLEYSTSVLLAVSIVLCLLMSFGVQLQCQWATLDLLMLPLQWDIAVLLLWVGESQCGRPARVAWHDVCWSRRWRTANGNHGTARLYVVSLSFSSVGNKHFNKINFLYGMIWPVCAESAIKTQPTKHLAFCSSCAVTFGDTVRAD